MSTSTTRSRPTGDPPMGRVLLDGGRPAPPGAASASLTFAWRGLLKVKHVPDQLVAAVVFPIITTLTFAYLLGGAIAGSPREYLQYFLPGVVTMAAAMTTTYTGMMLNLDIAKGSFDRFQSLPIWRPSVLVGSMLGDVVRYLVSSAVPLLVGLALGFRPAGGVTGVLAALLLLQVFSFSMAWIWALFSVLIREPTAMQGLGSPLILILTFASNVLVDPATMPSWLRGVVDVNPVSVAATGVRELMHGTASAAEIGWVFVASAALIALFAPPTVFFYSRKQR